MEGELERLVDSLLYEGYALYPYTPGATKNATPTPFGIVYPPAYAERNPSTHDRSRVECIAEAEPEAELRGTVRFLQVAGERHEAIERRVDLDPARLEELLGGGSERVEFEFDGTRRVSGRARIRAETVPERGLAKVTLCVHNTTELAPAEVERMDRRDALPASLVSTHIVARLDRGRFVSPLERKGPTGAASARCRNENTWPVLASPSDDAILGAAIFLPDHPQMAPESLGNLFDATEIEEALLLHIHALSEGERSEIAAQDPALREMVERAAATTPEDIARLHGRLELADSGPSPEPGHPNPGEDELSEGGKTFRKGAKVVLRPGTERDVYDRLLDGRTATIERIYRDYDDAVHIAVTVDGSAEQELYRETGRYLFFKPGEVDVLR
jgi:hypothetical protein